MRLFKLLMLPLLLTLSLIGVDAIPAGGAPSASELLPMLQLQARP